MARQDLILLSILIIFPVIKNQECEKIIPNTTSDCFNRTVNCCYLSIYGSKKISPRCAIIPNDTSTAIIETYSYNVQCSNQTLDFLIDFASLNFTNAISNLTNLNFSFSNFTNNSLLPFESCGVYFPSNKKDCIDASTNSTSCCFASFGGLNYCFNIGKEIIGHTFYNGITLDCLDKMNEIIAILLFGLIVIM